jgi:transposase
VPNPCPIELHARAVRAYESSDETCEQVAARFQAGVATLERWLRRQRRLGTLDPLAKAGGWTSSVDGDLLQRVVAERPDRTTDELTRKYNRRAAPDRARPSVERPTRPPTVRVRVQETGSRPAELDRARF